jgi:flagellar protein FliS
MTMTAPALRTRYLNDSVATASPARLLVMLYERLVVDLSQAETALDLGDRDTAGQRLIHAQEIVLELHASLRPDIWDGAANLAEIYTWVLTELVTANVRGDVTKVRSCRALIEPLGQAWREAAAEATAAPMAEPAASTGGSGPDAAPPGRRVV